MHAASYAWSRFLDVSIPTYVSNRRTPVGAFDLALSGGRFRWSRGRASKVCGAFNYKVEEKRGETYDAHARTECAWWEVRGEFRLDNTRVSVWTGDTARCRDRHELNNRGEAVRDNAPPDDANLGALDLPLGFVDEGHTLRKDGSGRVRWG